MLRASLGQGSRCEGQQSPNLADSAKKICVIPAQPLRVRGSQPQRGFQSFPGSKKSDPAATFCGMASQTPFPSTKQREERLFFALFISCTAFEAVFAGAHQHLALYHCQCRNCCASTADHMPLSGRRRGLSTVCRKQNSSKRETKLTKLRF